MVKCPVCGNESNTKFCPNCGNNLENMNLCPNCGNELEKDVVFCPNCGEKIRKENPDKEETENETQENTEDKEKETENETQENTEDKEETNDKINHCPHCNEELEKDEIFCSNCGKKVEIDENSLEGIFSIINYKKLTIASLIGFLLSFLLSVLLSIAAGKIGYEIYTYPIAVILATIIGVCIPASSFEDTINTGLGGIIVGFLMGLFSNTSVEISTGFKYSYQLFSGYEIIVFTIIGFVMSFIINKFLKKHIEKHVNFDFI